jgi:1-carboxybiuret hydrolase subunit AtzH-like protein
MNVNAPEILAEVKAAFDRYERALGDNDIPVLNELFWHSDTTVRYGVGEELYGYNAICGFRAARDPVDLKRVLTKVTFTTYGADFATACCEYRRVESGKRGRQMQTWMRTPEGWKIVAAHVSLRG